MTGKLTSAAVILVCAAVTAHAQPPLQGTSAAPSPLPMTMRHLGVPSAEVMLGKTVSGKDDRPIGIVEDLILGPEGQIRQLVVAPGAAPGNAASNTGPNLVAIDFSDVRMRSDSAQLHVPDLDTASLSALPAFDYVDGMVSLNRRVPHAPSQESR